jgi:hypothetical protein
MMHDAGVSLLDYLFDTEVRQRTDINAARATTSALSSGVASLTEQVAELRVQNRELAATVAVLARVLAESGQLDLTALRDQVTKQLGARPPAPAAGSVTCVRCGAVNAGDEMVRVGASIWCRTCAANP